MPREFSRQQRLGAQLRRSLSELLRLDVKDPSVRTVSLTTVELSRDLSVARVYFSLLKPDDDPEPAREGLERAAGYLRRRLGRELAIRHVPELRFVHDDSIEHGARISKLIDDARDADGD